MKTETSAQREKRLRRENRQRERLLKEQNKKEGKYYLFYLVFVLTIIYIVDEIASNMNSTMQPYMVFDLFNIPGANTKSQEFTSTLSFLGMLSLGTNAVLMLLTPFYKALADKFGRKVFLFLNTTLMGVGLAVCMIAPHWAIYILGIMIVQFVQTNDMQIMYIMETAPAKHRAKICNLTKAIALVSVSLVGVLHKAFYNPENLSSWRYVFAVPAALGIIIGLSCLFTVRETPVFIKGRLEYLNMTDEERAAKAEAEKKSGESAEGGVPAALKYIFRTPQMRWLAIAGLIFTIATGITGYYSSILEASKDAGVLTKTDVSDFLIIYPFINGVFTFICGVLSDAIGRKKGTILFSIVACVGVLMFVFGSRFGWPFWIIALGYGMFIGTLWSVTDTICLVMPAESTPTKMRASVMGTMSLLLAVGMVISTVLFIVGLKFISSSQIGMFGFAISVPAMLISCIFMLKVRETKGTDLTSIE